MEPKPERFVFENRAIGDWLLQLLEEDVEKRKTAAKVISNRFYMPVDLLPKNEGGVDEFLAEFSANVRNAVNAPGFPAADFVQDLLSLDLALHESWCAKSRLERERENEADKAELSKLGEHPTEAAKKRYVRRVWIRTLRDCQQICKEEPHDVFTTGMALAWVIQALGPELLPAADVLRQMLFSRHKAYVASAAIARMGRAGLVFYEDLLQGLNKDEPNRYCSRALGALLRSAPEKIPEVLRLACDGSAVSRAGAIAALGECGRKASEVCPEVESRLREILDQNSEESIWYATVEALGKTGQSAETVSSLLASLGHAGPEKTGALIGALGNIAKDPERVVPRLIELLDTFDEYDPDWAYHGEHERVTQALSAFGPAAASAVMALIRHIWTKPEQYWTKEEKLAERPEPDESIINLLGELGPLASQALPGLLEMQGELKHRGEELPFLDAAINRIRPCESVKGDTHIGG